MVILRRDAQQQLTETMEQKQPTQAIAFQAYEGVLRCFCTPVLPVYGALARKHYMNASLSLTLINFN